jgi:L-fuconolactonase
MGVVMSLDITGKYRYPAPRAQWLALHKEEIIEPDRPIIDPHHHIWMQDGNVYLLDELAEDLGSGHAIEATVFVQASYGYRNQGPHHLRCVGETEQVAQLANEAKRRGMATRVCAGVVGFADMMLGEKVAEVLDAHLSVAPDRIRGMRHSVSRDEHFPDGIVLRPATPKLLAERSYRRGLAKIAEYGLSYDCMMYHQQIPELTDLAHSIPDLSIILDHFGCIIGVGPYLGREDDTFRTWRADMTELAKNQNVTVKLGGMGMIICGPTWNQRDLPPSSQELANAWKPYVETCIDLFGAHRCMFESNFPVDKGMFSYPVLWNAFKRIASGATEDEKSALFHDTAARIYRI